MVSPPPFSSYSVPLHFLTVDTFFFPPLCLSRAWVQLIYVPGEECVMQATLTQKCTRTRLCIKTSICTQCVHTPFPVSSIATEGFDKWLPIQVLFFLFFFFLLIQHNPKLSYITAIKHIMQRRVKQLSKKKGSWINLKCSSHTVNHIASITKILLSFKKFTISNLLFH